MNRTFLVTGAAGFIGAALVQRLLAEGERVVGIDNINDYYDPTLKEARLKQIELSDFSSSWSFKKLALENNQALLEIFQAEKPEVVVNLAAQAVVRYLI